VFFTFNDSEDRKELFINFHNKETTLNLNARQFRAGLDSVNLNIKQGVIKYD